MTNWHVVSGRNIFTKDILHPKGAIPDRLWFRVGVRGDVGQWMAPGEVLLYDDADTTATPEYPRWLEHPVYRDKLDIVAIPFLVPEGGHVRTIDAVNTMPTMYLPIGRYIVGIVFTASIVRTCPPSGTRNGMATMSSLSR